jgi:DNA-binding transcriptional ArsR family regulator
MINQSGTLDEVFQALADPTRRSLVERLIRSPASVSELAKPMAMSLPAVMQHLHVLETCRLVRSEKVGRVRTCHLEPEALRQAEEWINVQRLAWETRLDRLGAFLEDPADATHVPHNPPTDPPNPATDPRHPAAIPHNPPSKTPTPQARRTTSRSIDGTNRSTPPHDRRHKKETTHDE